MKTKIYQVDAFTNELFGGNPAAVCPLDEWLSEELMQQIAMENNLAETAFYVKDGEQYHIRWFTPTVEVDLCGHATLATAFVLFNYEGHQGDTIHFYSPRSGALAVEKRGELYTLNFPVDEYQPVELSAALTAGFNLEPQAALKGKTDYVLVYKNEEEIKSLMPSMDKIAELDARGMIVTAAGNDVDFVSRFFAPQSGVNEDPVTGSAHTTLTPYWAKRLGKSTLTAMQLSSRMGHLQCKDLGERVEISGNCRLYLMGEINVE